MPYNLSEAFEAIEDELISSMVRNLKRHQAEETDQGFEWEQWQALQLRALEDYRKRNQKKFPPTFSKLTVQIDELLRDAYKSGRTDQERKILKAIRRGFTAPPAHPFRGEMKLEGTFFQVNDRKLDALINAVNGDMSRAEYAVLRRADDQYRQVIYNAQVYANTGAGTYKKAVDMATRDFLRAGLDCVEYKNGSRHTLEDYSDMAIKTASKRAYLQGEGSMRDEWGIPTVIMNKRNCPCPKCAPFVGKVFIDDVWSGGQAYINGENKQQDNGAAAYEGMLTGVSPVTGIAYPLLSEAIAQGLYHPRCKDVHSTYFEGISTPPEDSQYTADELDEMAQQYEAQQKQGYCERQEKRYSRMSRYSLDPDNQQMYGVRAQEWGERAQGYRQAIDSAISPDKKAVETVEKSGGSGIIEEKGRAYEFSAIHDSGSGNITITDETIARVPELSVFDDEERNIRYQQANIDLLTEARRYPVGTEVSRVYGADMKPINGCGYIVGEKLGQVRIDNPDVPYHAFHNHPSGEKLGSEDLLQFVLRDNQLSITAEGNNANVFCMIRNSDSDASGYATYLIKKMDAKIFGGGRYSYKEIKEFDIGELFGDLKDDIVHQLKQFNQECIQGGEKYGFTYIESKTS